MRVVVIKKLSVIGVESLVISPQSTVHSPQSESGLTDVVLGFYYHFKTDEKLTVTFYVELNVDEEVGRRFFVKRGRKWHLFGWGNTEFSPSPRLWRTGRRAETD